MTAMTTAAPLSPDNGWRAAIVYLRASGEADFALRTTVVANPSAERLVVACDVIIPLVSGRVGRRLIAKCFADDSGARTFAVMRALEAALAPAAGAAPTLAGAAPTLAVPRALCYDAKRRCLVQERVEALPFDALTDPSAQTEALRATGVALAELHALDLPELSELPARRFDEHVGDLVHPHPEALAERRPELAGALRAVLAGCRAATEGGGRGRAAPLHRDLHPRQLFYDGRQVWLIDWDLAAAGDPGLDLGNFVALLEIKHGAAGRAMSAAFLEGYAARSAAWPQLAARLPGWQATACLRRACKAQRLGGAGANDEARRLLRRAEYLLEGRGGPES